MLDSLEIKEPINELQINSKTFYILNTILHLKEYILYIDIYITIANGFAICHSMTYFEEVGRKELLNILKTIKFI